jgi:tetratricopeptide (TPR) repeat protein
MKTILIIIILAGLIYFIYKRFFQNRIPKETLPLFNAFEIMKSGNDEYALNYLKEHERELIGTTGAHISALLKIVILFRLNQKAEALFLCDVIKTSFSEKEKTFPYYCSLYWKARIKSQSNDIAELNESIELFNEVISFEPTYGRAYLYKGIAYEYLGNKKEAYSNIIKAEELISSYDENNPNLGLTLPGFDLMTMPPPFVPSLYSKFSELTTIQVHKQRNND